MKSFIIIPKSPFLITPHLERFCLRNVPTPCIYENNSCRRILRIRGVLAPYLVRIISEGERPKIGVKVFTSDNEVAEIVLRSIGKIYRVGFDYKIFLEKCRFDEKLYFIARKYYGLRPTRMVNIYEALIDSIIEQNISLSLALRIKGRFVKAYGERKIIRGREFYAFPLPEKIGKLESLELKRRIKTTLAKAKAIIEVSRIYECLPNIREIEVDPDNFIDFITKVKGIGRWTAQISIAKVSEKFYIGPYGDLAVRRGFKKILGIRDEKNIENYVRKLEDYAGLILYLMALEGHQNYSKR